jgi:hypothetical protein
MLRRTLIGWMLAAALTAPPTAALMLWRIAHRAPTSAVPYRSPAALAALAAPRAGTLAQQRMAGLPSTEQARLLGQAASEDCAGVAAFAMGIGRKDADWGDAYWSVRCADGRSYAVIIRPDRAGTATALPCAVVKSAGMECFKHTPR